MYKQNISLNYKNFTGILQIYFSGEWFLVSGLFLTEHQIQLTCKHFGFNDGFIDYNLQRNPNDYSLLAINCSKTDTDLTKCKTAFFKNSNLNSFSLKNIQFTCYTEYNKSKLYFTVLLIR